jgi:hypothetical protein
MWLIFLLISFGYSLGLSTFEVLRGVCPVPPVVEFNPKSMQTRIFCQKCPPFTAKGSMEKPLNRTADFVIEYTLKVGNLWLAVYRSYSCESHASNFGGYIVFNEEGTLLHAESGYPGLCQNLSTEDILCLDQYMAQGILTTHIYHCRINSKYELSCKQIFATDTDIEEKSKIQYIRKLYIKDKDHFYFEVNQEGKLYPVHCKRNGDVFNCGGLPTPKRSLKNLSRTH